MSNAATSTCSCEKISQPLTMCRCLSDDVCDDDEEQGLINLLYLSHTAVSGSSSIAYLYIKFRQAQEKV